MSTWKERMKGWEIILAGEPCIVKPPQEEPASVLLPICDVVLMFGEANILRALLIAYHNHDPGFGAYGTEALGKLELAERLHGKHLKARDRKQRAK